MNLAKLFELQKELDARILAKHPPKEGEDRLAKKILALQVELGELANEWRGFKYWSNDQKPRRAVYEICEYCEGRKTLGFQQESCWYCGGTGLQVVKRPLLEEYVDCLHFTLSIGLELNFTDIDVWKVKETTTTNRFIECFGTIYNIHFQKTVNSEVPRVMYEHLFAYFIGLGEMLGFTLVQVEQAYYKKNRLNHQRQETNY